MIFYLKIFKLIFVAFSLYLLGYAFFRWDGFSYYASLGEFLPSVALITIIINILAALTAFVLWMPVKIAELFFIRAGIPLKKENLLFFMFTLFLLTVIAWVVKLLIWTGLGFIVGTTFTLKIIVLSFVFLLSIYIAWIFRNKAGLWTDMLNTRINPLVWLFSIWTIVSISLVFYHTWIKQADHVSTQKRDNTSISKKKQPNILLVTFDTLTARDMSVYGYEKETTPFISEWSKSASMFTRAEAAGNYTASTTASLMTGKRIWTHQTYHTLGSKPLESSTQNLPLLMQNNGYYVMAFIANPIASPNTLGIDSSIDLAPNATEFSNPVSLFRDGVTEFGFVDKYIYELFNGKIRLLDWFTGNNLLSTFWHLIPNNPSETTTPPEKAFNKFLSVLDDNPPEPFFAWIHLLPPHEPYLPPEPFSGKCGARSDRACYDKFIRYCDDQFRIFIEQLKTRGKLEDTIIILSSDHGESFEHDYIGHGLFDLYEQVTHIPLIIKEPNQEKPLVIHNLVEQIDIPATIVDLAGLPVPPWMEGRSLVPLMNGESIPQKPVFSMALQKNRSNGHRIVNGTVAVWEGDYKLIQYIEDEKYMLFNLKKDPDELDNIFNKNHEVAERLVGMIRDNLEKANMKITMGSNSTDQ